MSKIDTTAWAEFLVGDLFEVVNGRKYPLTWRVPGDIPLVSTSRLANGVSSEVGFPEGSDYVTHSNLITVAYSGSVGATFYHEGSVFVGETVMGLLPRQGIVLTRAIGLFLAAVIEASVSHFTYEHKLKVSDMRERISIRLPIASSGYPDWDYMEQTMRDVFAQQEHELDELVVVTASSGPSIDTSSWGEFRIADLFEVGTGSLIPRSELIDAEAGLPRVSVSGINNGIVGCYVCSSGELRVFENFISVSFLGSVFYQPQEASLEMKVHALRPRGVTLTENTGGFLVACVEASLRQWRVSSYSDQISSKLLPDVPIRLPITRAGDPDWDYMEQTMQKVMAERKAALDSLQALVNEA